MSLTDSKSKRLTILCALYLAQGIPWGFMDITLVNYLIDKGTSVGEAAGVAAFILLPWAFKLVWAPLMDTVTLRKMGRRRPWIIAAQLMMGVTLIGVLMIPDITADLTMLKWMFFLHNVFASMQDVATDALAVDLLPAEEQGRANGMMWGSKLVGYGGGGYLFAQMIEYSGSIQLAVYAQMALLGCIMILPMVWIERSGETRFPWSRGGENVVKEMNYGNPRALGFNLVIAFTVRTTCLYLLFTLLHNLGPEIGKFMAKGICKDELSWTHIDLTSMRLNALLPEMLLAGTAGVLSQAWGRRTILVLGMGSYAALNIVAAAFPQLWTTTNFPAIYLVLSPGLIAVGSVGFLSLAMRISWTQALGTVFTCYMALSNVSAVIGKQFVGVLHGTLEWSYYECFYCAAFFALLPLLFLPYIRPSQMDDPGLIRGAINNLNETTADWLGQTTDTDDRPEEGQ